MVNFDWKIIKWYLIGCDSELVFVVCNWFGGDRLEDVGGLLDEDISEILEYSVELSWYFALKENTFLFPLVFLSILIIFQETCLL